MAKSNTKKIEKGPSPVDRLIEAVEKAIRTYEASGDHDHEKTSSGDCLVCALKDAVGIDD